jgi:hypothetical protein
MKQESETESSQQMTAAYLYESIIVTGRKQVPETAGYTVDGGTSGGRAKRQSVRTEAKE